MTHKNGIIFHALCTLFYRSDLRVVQSQKTGVFVTNHEHNGKDVYTHTHTQMKQYFDHPMTTQ